MDKEMKHTKQQELQTMKLEQTMLEEARRRLFELKSFSKNHEHIDEVLMPWLKLRALIEIAYIVDSGLSSKGIAELERMGDESIKILDETPKTKAIADHHPTGNSTIH